MEYDIITEDMLCKYNYSGSGTPDDPYVTKEGEDVNQYFSVEQSLERADENGWDVVYPCVNELQLDLDTYDAYLDCIVKLTWLRKFPEFKCSYAIGRSKNDKWHITVKFDKNILTHMERIALQASLGSDFKKELISYMRVKNGEDTPCLFFELPDRAAPTVIK